MPTHKGVAQIKFCTKACQNVLRGPRPHPLLYIVGNSHDLRGKFPFLAYRFWIFDFLIILCHHRELKQYKEPVPLTPVSLW